MKKKSIKKLILNKESIAKLNDDEKHAIKGGVFTGTSYCCTLDCEEEEEEEQLKMHRI